MVCLQVTIVEPYNLPIYIYLFLMLTNVKNKHMCFNTNVYICIYIFKYTMSIYFLLLNSLNSCQ